MTQQYFMCGCGWLGLPLARELQAQGHTLYGTSTRVEQCQKLTDLEITAFPLMVSKDSRQNFSVSDHRKMISTMQASDWVLLNIPPKRRDLKEEPFLSNLQSLVNTILTENNKTRILFISTTSVFGPIAETLVELDETSPTSPTTASGRVHAQMEQWLLSHYPQQSAVLRLGGLISATRHPITSICKREQFSNGQQVVNLIHQVDAIRIIQAIFVQNQTGEIFHGCAPEHPSRLDYYQQSAKSKGLVFPNFASEELQQPLSGKSIQSKKTQQVLGFEYEFNSPYDML
jgi:nucleoside-diphosphate-sugar epimerase